MTVRYGLIIESYLKANPDHIHLLYKQFEGLNKLNGVSQLVKAEKIFDKVSFNYQFGLHIGLRSFRPGEVKTNMLIYRNYMYMTSKGPGMIWLPGITDNLTHFTQSP